MEKSFPCAPGLTLLIPLWQDKGLQIICLYSLVLLIFISAARTVLLIQLSKLLENLCVHDTVCSDVKPAENFLIFVTIVPGKERNPFSLLWRSQECPGINPGSSLLGCPRGKHHTVYSAVQLGSEAQPPHRPLNHLQKGSWAFSVSSGVGSSHRLHLLKHTVPRVIAAGQKPDVKSLFSRFLHPGDWH